MRATTDARLDRQFNDKAMAFAVFGLTSERHEFALARGLFGHPVEGQLGFVFGVIDCHLSDVLDIRDIAALATSRLARLSIRLTDKGYRLVAGATEDRVAHPVN